MSKKPAHLTPEYSAHFKHESVVDVYHLRLPYPSETFDILCNLIVDEPRAVLDVGTGTGDIARELLKCADRVDALDYSAPMLQKARAMPNGEHPHLHWILGKAEDAALHPPYALITGGDSIHWMDWDTLFLRFQQLLTPNGHVALVGRREIDLSWQSAVMELIAKYSVFQKFEAYDLGEELEKRGLFKRVGDQTTAPVTNQQSVADYVESFHSRSSLSREKMSIEDVNAFDEQLAEIVQPYAEQGLLSLQTVGRIIWGKPLGK